MKQNQFKKKPSSSSSSSSSIRNDPRLIAVAQQAIAAQPAQLHEFLVATTLHFLHRTERIHTQREGNRQFLERVDKKDPPRTSH
jgi:hypothetical protein